MATSVSFSENFFGYRVSNAEKPSSILLHSTKNRNVRKVSVRYRKAVLVGVRFCYKTWRLIIFLPGWEGSPGGPAGV